MVPHIINDCGLHFLINFEVEGWNFTSSVDSREDILLQLYK
jgi:hypothetical protein